MASALTVLAGGCVAGGLVLSHQSRKSPANCFSISPVKSALASPNLLHGPKGESAGSNDGKNHFYDERLLMFWLESEQNGEYSNFYPADVYFLSVEFHSRIQALLPKDDQHGLIKFCCGEALMFTIKLNLLIIWAEAKYTASDPACQELVSRALDAVVKLTSARDGDSIKEASRLESALIPEFNKEVWFTNIQAYVQYIIVWAKFRGSGNSSLLAQLEALPHGTIPLEASPWDKIYGACPDESYDWLQRDISHQTAIHREGYPVGADEAFLTLLQSKLAASDRLRFGPMNGLGKNYLGIAIECTRFQGSDRDQPGLQGLLSADGNTVATHPQYKQYCEFLGGRIA